MCYCVLNKLTSKRKVITGRCVKSIFDVRVSIFADFPGTIRILCCAIRIENSFFCLDAFAINFAVFYVIVVHAVEQSKCSLRARIVLCAVIVTIKRKRNCFSEICIVKKQVVSLIGSAGCIRLNVKVESIGFRREIGTLRRSVIRSNLNVHTDAVKVTLLESKPCGIPLFDLFRYDSVCLILVRILRKAISKPFVITRNGIGFLILIICEFVGTPACALFLCRAVAVGIRSFALVFASFPQIFLDKGPIAEIVTCLISKVAFCIERIQSSVNDHNEFILVVANEITDFGEVHLGISVLRNKEVKFFVRFCLPEFKNRFPSRLHRCVCFDFGKSFSFKSKDRFNRCVSLTNFNYVVCSSFGIGTCGQTPSAEIMCFRFAVIGIRRTCTDYKIELAVKACIVCAVGISCIKPTGLTLFDVVLSIVNDVVARIVVGRGCKKVFRRKLLAHRVNEVSSFDRRAVIPFKIVAKRHCKSLTFFSVGSKTILACIFFRYVLEFGRRRVFNGECAGNDLAVCIEFVVELIECTREIRFHRVVDVVT